MVDIMRTRFDSELETLYVNMIKMGALSEDALNSLQTVLAGNDKTKLADIVDLSHQIDRMERDIESLCLRLLLRRQPVARDQRTISSAMKMVGDIERIGDNAADISEIIPFISSADKPAAIGLDAMVADVSDMVSEAIDAFVRSDIKKAEAVISKDDIVDAAFNKAKEAITEMIRSGSKEATEAPDLLMIAKYLERMGDHAASLARWVLNAADPNSDWINNPPQVD